MNNNECRPPVPGSVLITQKVISKDLLRSSGLHPGCVADASGFQFIRGSLA